MFKPRIEELKISRDTWRPISDHNEIDQSTVLIVFNGTSSILPDFDSEVTANYSEWTDFEWN